MRRALVFTLLGFFALTVLGPVQGMLGLDMVVLDVPLIIVIYLAMSDRGRGLGSLSSRGGLASARGFFAGGAAALMMGYAVDLLGGGLKGVHCFTLVVVFLVSRRAARQVYLAGTMSSLLVTFSASLGGSVLGLGMLWLTGSRPGLGNLTVALIQAIIVAAMAPLVIRVLRAIDNRLMRDNRERGTMLS